MAQLKKIKTVFSVKELSFDRYIDCVCNKNLQALALEDNVPEVDLLIAWKAIRSEFMELMDDPKSKYLLSGTWEIRHKQYIMPGLLNILQFIEYYHMFGWGKKPGFDLKLEAAKESLAKHAGVDREFTADSYKNDVAVTRVQWHCEMLSVQQLEEELHGMTEGGVKMTEQVFYTSVAHLQKGLGILPNMAPVAACKAMTVYDYILYIKQYNQLAKNNKPKEDTDGAGY